MEILKYVAGNAAGAACTIISYLFPSIYQGEYFDTAPYDPETHPLDKIYDEPALGPNDDFRKSKIARLVNPNNNEMGYSYYEKEIDTETTEKILAKYKTNEEILTRLQNGMFLGRTLIVHRNIISPFMKYTHGENNRVTGLTSIEPKLKDLDVPKLPKLIFVNFPIFPGAKDVEYMWTYNQIKQFNGLFPLRTVIYGVFQFADFGTRTNGGYFELVGGSDLSPAAVVQRLEYFNVENEWKQKNMIIRYTIGVLHMAPNSPKLIDRTQGGHELLTRGVVLDAIRSLKESL